MIKNEPTLVDDKVVNITRACIEHRALWMGLMMKEAEALGIDPEEFTRRAITKCGHFHGDNMRKTQPGEGLPAFKEVFIPEHTQGAFEMDVVTCTEDELYIEFHYCPLLSAWKKQGFSEEDFSLMCDCAMDGDRGIAAENGYGYWLGKTIANGDDICQVKFTKK